MRKLQKLQKTVVYDYAILRFTLPDGVTVRGHFYPDERLSTVRMYLATECLSDPNAMFDICDVAPPRAVLNYGKTLEKLRLVPAAKVTIRWKEAQRTSTIRPELFLSAASQQQLSATSSATSTQEAPSFPTAKSLAAPTKPAASDETNNNKNNYNVPTSTAADREEELMRRMMGGGGNKPKK
jgi:hypothetical protein